MNINEAANLTQQELFDFVCGKLIEQNARSADEDGYCKYRMPDGRRCAAGWVMGDAEYMVEYEGTTIDGFFPHLSSNYELLYDLQQAHDFAGDENFTTNFKERALLVAKKYNLFTGVLK